LAGRSGLNCQAHRYLDSTREWPESLQKLKTWSSSFQCVS